MAPKKKQRLGYIPESHVTVHRSRVTCPVSHFLGHLPWVTLIQCAHCFIAFSKCVLSVFSYGGSNDFPSFFLHAGNETQRCVNELL
jgi:hypothetical protein